MFNKSMAVALGLLASGAHGGDLEPKEWESGVGGNGHWYQGVQSDMELDWHEAHSAAMSRGGYLVTLTSPEENLWVGNHAISPLGTQPRHGPWIGLYQDRMGPDYAEPWGGWAWVTGEPLDFQNWDSTNPNNDANQEDWASISNFTFEWIDVPVYTGNGQGVFAFVIEWSADCNGDGQVDFGQIQRGELVDANEDGVPDVCTECFADLDGNGELDFFDISGFLVYYQLGDLSADFTGDGQLDFFDVSVFLSAFTQGCP